MGVVGKVQHPQYALFSRLNPMFYKGLLCGKKVQFFATKSAIFFNALFLIHLFFRVCGKKKKCNMIALILHFYCTFIALLLHFEGSQFLFLFHCVKRIFFSHVAHVALFPIPPTTFEHGCLACAYARACYVGLSVALKVVLFFFPTYNLLFL